MPASTDDSECVGKYIMNDGRIIKSAKSKIVPEEAKNQFLQFLLTQSVEKQYAKKANVEASKKESQCQTMIEKDTEKLGKNGEVAKKKTIPNICRRLPKPPPTLLAVVAGQKGKMMIGTGRHLIPDKEASESIGIAVKLVLRRLIEEAKKFENHANRRRMIPQDVDLAFSQLRTDYELLFPVLKPTPTSDRPYWGRRVLSKPSNTIPANSTDLVSNERFCDSKIIKIVDHWLCVDGIQPCVQENVVPSEVRQKFQQKLEESQRMIGIGVKKEQNFEKRVAKQVFSMEHQVLFNEIVNVLANGTPLERQKVLQFIENDTGLQFLVGRFVVFIAEGVRVNIAAKNVKSLANLIKLTWSLMKNPRTKVEKYLFELVPSLISCAVVKSIMPLADIGKMSAKMKNSEQLSQEDEERIIRDLEIEFRVRECSSRVLAMLCEQCPNQSLSVRIIRILKQILTTKSDPATLYGTLCIFYSFGYLTIKMVIIPRLHDIYCELMTCENGAMMAQKTGPSKYRKVIGEAEQKRIEIARNRVVELVMKILYEYEAYDTERRIVEEEKYKELYGEFGAMFYRHLIETGRIDDDGKILVTRPSLLAGKMEKLEESREKETIGRYTQQNAIQQGLDEDMLENLLDDSNRPWAEVSKRVEEKEHSDHGGAEKIDEIGSNMTFFGSPKLVLMRRDPRAADRIVSVRALELAHIPTIPTTRFRRHEKAGQIRSSRSAISVDEDPADLLKKYLTRPALQAAAVTYGRSIEVSETGRAQLDRKISEAANRLSQCRLRNSVANSTASRSTVGGGGVKEEVNRGKFLVPSAERGNRL